jgi:hypothetical protein
MYIYICVYVCLCVHEWARRATHTIPPSPPHPQACPPPSSASPTVLHTHPHMPHRHIPPPPPPFPPLIHTHTHHTHTHRHAPHRHPPLPLWVGPRDARGRWGLSLKVGLLCLSVERGTCMDMGSLDMGVQFIYYLF